MREFQAFCYILTIAAPCKAQVVPWHVSEHAIGFITINIILNSPMEPLSQFTVVYNCTLNTRVTGHALELCLVCYKIVLVCMI